MVSDMYLSMLRRDLKDQKALNAVLFIFMIVAAAAIVMSATLMYSMLVGEQITYEKCNTTDVICVIPTDMSDAEGLRQEIRETFESYDITRDIHMRQVVSIPDTNVIVYGDDGMKADIPRDSYTLTAMPQEFNIPYTLNGERFEVPNGCIAVSQMFAARTGLSVGETMRLVTQMGNVYEFTVSTIFRDPVEMAVDMFILSDRDCGMFYGECPMKCDYYEINLDVGDADYVDTIGPIGTDILLEYEDQGMVMNAAKIALMNDEGLMVIIIVVAVTIVALFVMAMIMTTIDFSLKSMVKREAKQIGMMKAIGVWSFSYKVLFIVKYIAFAIVCGLIGLPLGFMLTEKVYDSFVYNIIFPDKAHMIAIGAIAMLVNIGCVLIFSFVALRRMNKISVIDAIHGENRGERFRKLPGLSLARSRRMPVASYLAVSDIFRALKRYIYLILAYTLGIAAVLFMVQLKDTLLDVNYIQHYFQRSRIDFDVELGDSYRERLMQEAGSITGAYDIINRTFEENGIPARIILEEQCPADVYHDGEGQPALICWNDGDTSDIYYLPGGNAPVLYNEVAIPWYQAEQSGIKIGDIVTIEYDRFSEDHTYFSKVSEDFVVTGFIDFQGANTMRVIMGNEFDGAVVQPGDVYSAVIDVPAGEYEATLEKMQSLWSEDELKILNKDQVVDKFMEGYDLIFNMMIAVTASAAAVVLILLTCLYENIFIEEETADIALLKSMGFKRSVIRGWHLIRLMILGALSMVLALLVMRTFGNALAGFLYTSLCRTYEFILTPDPVSNYVIVPACVLAGLTVVVYLMTRLTDSIRIWKVRTE